MSKILFFFGKIAVEKGFLTDLQVQEALEVQKNLQKIGYSEPLGKICCKLGFLTEKQVDEILEVQSQDSKINTHLYGKVALSNGLVTPSQIEECLQLQKKMETYAPIGHYLLQKKYISLKDHQAVLKAIDRIATSNSPAPPTPEKGPEKEGSPLQQEEEQQLRQENALCGKIALDHGLITRDQLREAEIHSRSNHLWDYLIEKKYISSRDHFFVQSTIENVQKTERASQNSTRKKTTGLQVASKIECLRRIKSRFAAERFFQPRFSSPRSSDTSTLSFLSKLGAKKANLLPDYILVEKLGYGGMAVVYKGLHKASRREVAIKILPPTEVALDIFDSDMVHDEHRQERFLREANLLRLVRHPNIVTLIDIGNHKGYHYYVMEYVRGITLSELLDEVVCLEETWALEIGLNVAMALIYSWNHKIVHRDIKPENIMITTRGEVKVFDFGLAKSLEPGLKEAQLTSHDVVLGTPTYMAPEQTGLLKGKSIDVRSDIYSLGVSLYDMLVGMPPYHDESPLKLMVMHFKEPIPLACSKRPQISMETSKLIQKMMAKNLEERFSDPQELARAIEELQRKLPPKKEPYD